MFYLRKLSFHITERCNLQCFGCDNHSNLGIEDKYTNVDRKTHLKNFLTYIDALPFDFIIERFHFIGGEPFLNKNLEEFIEIISKYTHIVKKIVVYTNGTILNKDVLNRLIKYKDIIHIHISVHTSKNKVILSKIDKLAKYLEFKKFNYYLSNHVINNEWVLQWKYHKNKIYPANENKVKETWLYCTKKDCKILDGDRIYYCSPIAFIKDGLQKTNQVKEEVWQPYIDVGYFHYENMNPYDFVRSIFEHKEKDYCNMCLTHTPNLNNYPIFKKDYDK